MNFFRLSRAGARAAADPNVSFTAVGGQEARTLLHPAIAESALGDLERAEYDKAVFSAFRRLEIETSRVVPNSERGKRVFYDAFAIDNAGGNRGPLVPTSVESGEAKSLRELFAGAYGCLRNPAAHRNVNDDAEQTMRYLLLASCLHYILDDLKSANAGARD